MSRPKSVEEALEIYYKKREVTVVAPPALTAVLLFHTSNDGISWTITDPAAP